MESESGAAVLDAPPEAPSTAVTTDGVRKVPTILQIEAVECGAASLGMIAASFGKWVPLSDLRKDCRVSRDGASATGIIEAAEILGLQTDAKRASTEELQGAAVPGVVWWKKRHFVVLEGAKNGKFFVNDPALGKQTYAQDYFDQNYSGVIISLKPGESFTKGGKPFSSMASLGRRLPPVRKGVIFALIAGLLAMIPGLALAPISSLFVDDVLGSGSKELLPFLIATLVVVFISRVLLIGLEYAALTRVQAKLAFENNAEFLLRLFRLPLLFFASRNIGDLVQRMGYSSAVAQLLAGQLASSIISVIALAAYVALMFYYNWILALIVLVLSALNVVALRAVIRRRTVGQGLLMSESGHLQSITIGSIQSISTLKASGLEEDAFGKWTGQQTRVVTAEASFVTPTAVISAVPTVLTMFTSAAILVIGAMLVSAGDLALGGLLAFQSLAAGIVGPITTLVGAASQIQTIETDLERLDDALANPLDSRFLAGSEQPGLSDVKSASIVPMTGEVTLSSVQFGYTDGDPPLVDGLDLTLPAGHRVALVGPSGAGKSTIGNLIAGLYVPWSGSVTFDGRELVEISPDVLASGLAKVDQTVMLFEGTVRENLTMWDDSVSDDAIKKALADAQVLQQVLRRPGGLDADVLEGGLNFSTGEIQRLEIARSLVRSPSLLIMDEATSFLDTDTEKAMDDAIRARGCSTVIIAHRLSTIRDADEIIVLGRGGKVLERGSNDELVAAGGEYAKLVAEAGEGGDVGT
ncbi:MAG: cysteine peptidase family C39 domain-containing protein [Actinomycetes bacterium]